eukprot:417058-Pyramimonas_sp.AAC.1
MNSNTLVCGKVIPDPASQLLDHKLLGEVEPWKIAPGSGSSLLLPGGAELAVRVAAPLVEHGAVRYG